MCCRSVRWPLDRVGGVLWYASRLNPTVPARYCVRRGMCHLPSNNDEKDERNENICPAYTQADCTGVQAVAKPLARPSKRTNGIFMPIGFASQRVHVCTGRYMGAGGGAAPFSGTARKRIRPLPSLKIGFGKEGRCFLVATHPMHGRGGVACHVIDVFASSPLFAGSARRFLCMIAGGATGVCFGKHCQNIRNHALRCLP